MARQAILRSLVALTLLWAAGCSRAKPSTLAATFAGAAGKQEVQVAYHGPAELGRAIAAGLDLFGVNAQTGVAYGEVDARGLQKLQGAGLALTLQGDGRQLGVLNNFAGGYHTYEQVTSQLQAWSAQYPDRLALRSIGPSWETTMGKANRQLWSVRITGPGDASKRPAVSFTAGLHAREIVANEVGMNLIATLLQGYDQDPQIKSLLDTRVVYVAPMLNPDGHHQAEQGADWRKNTHAFPAGVGVDLNRNFPFQWNGTGSSNDAADQTYHGPSAASEPETQAVRDYLASIPNLKIGMDYHAFSNLVMWSWGWTSAPPPDATLLSTIGRHLASFNHYTPQQASDLYLTSGTIRDYVYGQLHVPCYTTEMGSEQDGFDPPYARAQAMWQENKPGALWLIDIADNPAKVLDAPSSLAPAAR